MSSWLKFAILNPQLGVDKCEYEVTRVIVSVGSQKIIP